VKKVVLLEPAVEALRKHRNVAGRILKKLKTYAENPSALTNQVITLRGAKAKRLRVGDFRILFEETEAEIIVFDLGPRGSIYD
jgi:mRNA interferase RelE/StbE